MSRLKYGAVGAAMLFVLGWGFTVLPRDELTFIGILLALSIGLVALIPALFFDALMRTADVLGMSGLWTRAEYFRRMLIEYGAAMGAWVAPYERAFNNSAHAVISFGEGMFDPFFLSIQSGAMILRGVADSISGTISMFIGILRNMPGIADESVYTRFDENQQENASDGGGDGGIIDSIWGFGESAYDTVVGGAQDAAVGTIPGAEFASAFFTLITDLLELGLTIIPVILSNAAGVVVWFTGLFIGMTVLHTFAWLVGSIIFLWGLANLLRILASLIATFAGTLSLGVIFELDRYVDDIIMNTTFTLVGFAAMIYGLEPQFGSILWAAVGFSLVVIAYFSEIPSYAVIGEGLLWLATMTFLYSTGFGMTSVIVAAPVAWVIYTRSRTLFEARVSNAELNV